MDCADPRAGQHRIGSFRNHGHVDCDPVALLDAIGLHHIGEPAHLIVELAIGDLLVVIGIVPLPDDGGLITALLEVPVDAVVGDVGHPVLEPLDRDLAVEAGVLDLGIGLEPVDSLAVLGPEFFRLFDALLVPFLVGLIIDQSPCLGVLEDLVGFLRHLNLLTNGYLLQIIINAA
jgi:hypothetical protein